MIELPMTPSFKLDGFRALVTGASSGIGLGCAVALAEAGADVVLASRNIKALNEAAEAIIMKGFSAETLQLDISDLVSIDTVLKDQKPFDVLVNSAGLGRHTPSLETSAEDFDEVMDVNLKGAYFLTQSIAKALIKAKKPGSLINISSQMGHVGGVDRAV